MNLQDKLRRYLEENGLQKQWFAQKLGMDKTRFYQILCGYRPLPGEYWPKLVELTGGRITLRDIIEEYFKEIEVVIVKDSDSIQECKVSFKRF